MAKTYIFDIDGTLADCRHRLHFIEGEHKDWDVFFAACADDAPIHPVIDVCRALAFSRITDQQARIVYLTGRSDSVRRETQEWLFQKHHLPMGDVIMRKAGDHRPDTQAKKELMESILAAGDEIAGVFEDRPSVCRVWRSMGLTVFQMTHEEF
jgi:phosphoglycolate phosphatase-like HAD superfamily hydrolase